jgi:glycosyltransferase involved in cell wall biosynthesis
MKILWGPDETTVFDQQLQKFLSMDSFNYVATQHFRQKTVPDWSDVWREQGPFRPDWVFLVDPLSRLMPRQMLTAEIPLLALTDAPVVMDDALLVQVLAGWDALLPRSLAAQQRLNALGLHTLTTVWMGIDPTVHRVLPAAERLHELLYYAPDTLAPGNAEYAQLSARWHPDFFIATNPVFLPFHFQRSRYVVLDVPELMPLHLEAMACGAILICPDGYTLHPLFQPGQHYLTFQPGELETCLETLTPRREAEIRAEALNCVQAFTYTHLADQLRTELQQWPGRERCQARLKRQQQEPLWAMQIEVWSQLSSPHPAALELMSEHLNRPEFPRDQRHALALSTICAEAARHPLNKGDRAGLLQHAYLLHEQMISVFERNLQALMLAWQQRQATRVLQLLADILPLLPTLPAQPLLAFLIGRDPLFRSLSRWYSPERALWLFCGWLELTCLEQCACWSELLTRSRIWLEQASLPQFHQLHLVALHRLGELQALQQHYHQTLAECPLEVHFCLQAATEIASRDAAAALEILSSGRALAARLIPALQSIEIFHALERLIWRKTGVKSEPRRDSYVLWEGNLQSHHSLALINRQLVAVLARQSALYLTCLPFDASEVLAPPPGDFSNHLQEPDVFVSHRWPPRFQAPQAGKWVNILPWEHGPLPEEWVTILKRELDEVWVPSRFVADSFEQSGLRPGSVRVIPNGTDTACFTPEGESWAFPGGTAKLRFLFVGGMIYRKGVDLLLQAYAQAFTRHDPVQLVLKGFGAQGVYSSQSLAEQFRYFEQNPEAPELVFLERSDLSAEEMASLYRGCDVYVHPYRGEGFGLPILEAMACGLPVVVPDAGPALEFTTTECAWYVPAWTAFDTFKNIANLGQTPFYPYYYEVDISALAQCLRAIAADPDQIAVRGQAARQAALAYSWEAMGQKTLAAIQALSDQQPPYRHRMAHALQVWQEQQQTEPAPEELVWIDSPETLLPLLRQRLHHVWVHQRARFGDYLAWALSQGLRLRDYVQLELPPALPAELTVFQSSEFVFLAPVLQASDYVRLVQHHEVAHVSLTSEPPFSGLVWLCPGQPLPVPTEAMAVWYTHPDQAEPLKALGWSSEKLLYLPPAVDFERLHPRIAPLTLDESLGKTTLLALPEMGQSTRWQVLLEAYLRAFTEQDPVNLVVKPLGLALDDAVTAVVSWLEDAGYDPEHIPGLTFVQEPLGWNNLPGLLTGSKALIALDDTLGYYALAAQAAGCRVIARGQYPFLARPFAEYWHESDREHLVWLLRQAVNQPAEHSGRAIREYLQPHYDLPIWEQRTTDFLEAFALRRQWGL